jgi:hypothetical protein
MIMTAFKKNSNPTSLLSPYKSMKNEPIKNTNPNTVKTKKKLQ